MSMHVFVQPTCVCEGGRPLRPYTPTRASFWTEMLNFKNCGWSIYSWDLQNTPWIKNTTHQQQSKSVISIFKHSLLYTIYNICVLTQQQNKKVEDFRYLNFYQASIHFKHYIIILHFLSKTLLH